jgi:polyvinyl alcohol dehydrogenase (cytochrome)
MRMLSWAMTSFLFFVLITKERKSGYSEQFGLIVNRPVNPGDSTFEKGKKVFYATCNSCHKDSGVAQAPAYAILTAMTPRAILAALNNGKMRLQGAALSESDRRAVAEWVTQRKLKETNFPQSAYTPFSLSGNEPVYSGWGGDHEGTGFRTSQRSGISTANIASLKLKWAFAFPDATIVRSRPAIVGKWLIVGGQYGDVFSIDKYTGKIGWTFAASAAIRGAIAVVKSGSSITAYFADYSTNVYALDLKTGKQLWNKRAGFDQQSATTGSVSVYNGKVYVPITSLEVAWASNGKYACCVSSGGAVALDARTGQEIWRHRVLAPAKESGKNKNGKPIFGPSGAPVWCSPTIDAKRGRLYIGTGENYSYPSTNTSDAIQALDLNTGKLIWNFQATPDDTYNAACPFLNNCPEKAGPDLDFGMAPIIFRKKDGTDILVAGQKSGVVYALSPVDGKRLWQTRIGKGGMLGGIHWGMATDGKYLYAANADNMLAIDKRDTSEKISPGLFALDPENGKLVWKTAAPDCGGKKDCYAANSAAPSAAPGIVFAGGLDGHIRAYATADGKIIWDFDTAKPFETSDGVMGNGGAIDGPSPVLSDGMLFVNSGYGMFGEMQGNLLLAFEVGKGSHP